MSKFDLNTIINTDRLILQPVSDEFKFDIWREFTAEVTKYMPFTPNGDIKVTEDFIYRSNQELIENRSIHLCIIKKESNEFLGVCGLHNIDTKAVEIGLWLKVNAHGIGYGTEVVRALINFAEKNLDIEYLYYPVDKDNIASRNIPEKLDFIQATTYLKMKNDNENLDIIEYRKKKTGRWNNN